jgi:hypothetical protein
MKNLIQTKEKKRREESETFSLSAFELLWNGANNKKSTQIFKTAILFFIAWKTTLKFGTESLIVTFKIK